MMLLGFGLAPNNVTPQTTSGGGYTCTAFACTGSGDTDVIFRQLQSLINKATNQYNPQMPGSFLTMVVDGKIDQRVVDRLNGLSRVMASLAFIATVNVNPNYVAAHVAAITKALQAGVGGSPAISAPTQPTVPPVNYFGTRFPAQQPPSMPSPPGVKTGPIPPPMPDPSSGVPGASDPGSGPTMTTPGDQNVAAGTQTTVTTPLAPMVAPAWAPSGLGLVAIGLSVAALAAALAAHHHAHKSA